MKHFFLGFQTVQGIFGLLFNSITFLCIIKFKFLWTPLNTLLASLTCSDLLHAIFNTAALLAKNIVSPQGENYAQICLLYHGAGGFWMTVQLSMFATISMERLISLRAAFRLHKTKWRMAKSFIGTGLSWSLGILMFAIIVLFRKDPSIFRDQCILDDYTQYGVRYGYIALIIAAICITVPSYILIARMFIQRNSQVEGNIPTTGEVQRRRVEFRFAKMLATITAVFVLLYTPFALVQFFTNSDSPPSLVLVHEISIILVGNSMWVKPVIYAWQSGTFRTAFTILIKTSVCRRGTTVPATKPAPMPAIITVDEAAAINNQG